MRLVFQAEPRPGPDNFDGFSWFLILELQALHLLQIIWFFGIFRMFISQVFTGSFVDVWYGQS